MKKIVVFLAEGFEEIEAITVIDILRRAGLEVTTVSIEKNEHVKGAHGITIIADKVFNKKEITDIEMIILPGGMPGTNNLNHHQELKNIILEYYKNKKYIAAICAAPLILGQLGILNNKKAVCYPGYEKELKGAIYSNEKVVIDNNIITSKGVGAAIDFSLKIVETLINKETATKLRQALVVE